MAFMKNVITTTKDLSEAVLQNEAIVSNRFILYFFLGLFISIVGIILVWKGLGYIFREKNKAENGVRVIAKEEAIKVIQPTITEVTNMKGEIVSIKMELHNINEKLDRANNNSEIIGRELASIAGVLKEHVRKDNN
jgi:uncharacterized membrane protein YgaE (UPF0421/DUF939 family)